MFYIKEFYFIYFWICSSIRKKKVFSWVFFFCKYGVAGHNVDMEVKSTFKCQGGMMSVWFKQCVASVLDTTKDIVQ